MLIVFVYCLCFVQVRAGVMRLQAILRARVMQRHYEAVRKHVLHVQRFARGRLARRNVRQLTRSVRDAQRFARGFLARKRFRELKADREMLSEAQRLRNLEEQKYKYAYSIHD